MEKVAFGPCSPRTDGRTDRDGGVRYRFEGLVAARLGHVEDFELSWHHSGRVLQELEVWLRLFLLLFLLFLLLLLLLFFLLLLFLLLLLLLLALLDFL